MSNDKNLVGVILAAGRGSRLKELSLEQPKPMITVNNQTIISNLIRLLIDSGLSHIVVIIGYKADRLREHLSHFEKEVKLTFVENPIYDQTNNIYSLWMARDFLTSGFFLFEADVFIEQSIVSDFMTCPDKDVMLVDRFTPNMNGTVITFDSSRKVTGMFLKKDQGETFSFENTFKTVNFYKISKNLSINFFLEKLDQHIRQQDTGSYYELIIKEAIDTGMPFHAFETGSRKWYEIDTREDLEEAEKLFRI